VAHDPSAKDQLHLARPKYRADIDGIRGLAVLFVVAFHAFPGHLPGGFVGVDVFFILSGFLISSIIFGSLAKGAFSFGEFYARRIKRIFPALSVVLIACFAFGWFALMADTYSQLGKHIAAGAGFVSNFAFLRETGYFDTFTEFKPLLHLWSLGIEEQFYLIWPLLLYIAWKWRLNLLVIALTVAITSFSLNIHMTKANPSAAFYLPITRFWELLLGSILAYGALNRRDTGLEAVILRLRPQLSSGRIANIRSVCGFILLGLALVLINRDSVFPGWRALLPTIGTCLLISAGPNAWLNRKVLSHPVIVWFGLISYPLYLWHWPLLSFARITQFGVVSTKLRFTLVLIAIVLAWLTYMLLERPIRFGGNSNAKVVALCVSLTVICAIGWKTFALNGFPERQINHEPKLVFIWHYQNLYDHGLAAAYRSECDFYDWEKRSHKRSIATACTAVEPGKSMFLWGDSHAQALSLGLHETLGNHAQLAQVATSGCRPSLVTGQTSAIDNDCDGSNAYALKEIARLKPAVVILAQGSEHQATDWDHVADYLHNLGASRVVLVGPAPNWLPSLPLVVVSKFWNQDIKYVKEDLDPTVFVTDSALEAKYGASNKLTYIFWDGF
jgi:peptidoglycan/LPS O-acetylase OafA/YrhL